MPSAAESLVESDDRKVLAGALFRGYRKENITLFHRHSVIQHGNDFRLYRLPVFSELLHWKVNKHHRYYHFFVTTFS